jgi:hypothetical protein
MIRRASTRAGPRACPLVVETAVLYDEKIVSFFGEIAQ